jgi:hypothetical protein
VLEADAAAGKAASSTRRMRRGSLRMSGAKYPKPMDPSQVSAPTAYSAAA